MSKPVKEMMSRAILGRCDGVESACVIDISGLDAIKTNRLRGELKKHVRTVIGPVATLDEIRFTDALPKTRSGKIMRRLLKQVAAGQIVTGDTTTLDDLSVLAKLATAED